jgi:chromosome segregation ATPase
MSVMEIEALRAQKKALEDTLVEIDQGIKIGNRHAIQDEINTVVNKISEMEYELKLQEQTAKIEQEHQELTEQAASQFSYRLDEMKIGDDDMRSLCVNEQAYQVLRIAVQQLVDEEVSGILKQLKNVKEENVKTVSGLKLEIETLKHENDSQAEMIAALRTELATEKETTKDLNDKRTAAVLQLEEANTEIERLNNQVQDLRTEIAIGAKGAAKVINTNVNSDLAAAMAEWKNSLPAIYDFEWVDTKRSQWKAKLAATGEEIVESWSKEKAYRKVAPEEVETFRTEHLAKQKLTGEGYVGENQSGTVEVEAEPVTAEQFQDETEADTTTAGLAPGVALPQVATKTVEERLEALENAVFGKVVV